MTTPALREATARRFPLVPRPKPSCHRLDVRVRQVTDLADTAARNTDEATRIAAEAHNLGALLASDCGLSVLARTLCRRQFDIFRNARPFDVATAKLALQPLINLGRLHARDGDGNAAHQLISTLFTAVRDRETLTMDGDAIDLSDLTRTPEDHRDITRWLWTIHLADGTRALTGHWSQALRHVQDHHGIGKSLLDGRQIAIIAHHVAGDHHTAARLLTATPTPTPWELAVAGCLAALTGHCDPDDTALIDSYLRIGGPPTQALFRTRLGLAVLDLSDDRHTASLAYVLGTGALESKDAYPAREILAHPECASLLPEATAEALTELLDASGLGAGSIPGQLLEKFTAAIETAEASLAQALTG